VLVAGYGTVGRELGRLAAAFGMRVTAVKADPGRLRDDSFCRPGTGDPEGRIPERVLGLEHLQDAAAESDALVVSLPLTDATRHAVSAAVIRALHPDAVVVNVGRGALVDTGAVVDALGAGRLGSAYLDVFEQEPLAAGDALWEVPRLTVTPHISGGADDGWSLLFELFAENLRRYVRGEPLLNPVSAERGY
jgi:phosphoglycerate dehydrogenase-like enzyme